MRERKDCENAHPPHLQLRRERRERREGERGRGVPVLSGAKEEERPKEGRSRSSAVRNKKKKTEKLSFFCSSISILILQAPCCRVRLLLCIRERHMENARIDLF